MIEQQQAEEARAAGIQQYFSYIEIRCKFSVIA